MTGFDIDALLAVEDEGAKRVLRDANTTVRGPDLGAGFAGQAKLLGVLRRAIKVADGGDNVGGLKLALKAIDLDPENAQANLIAGLMLERMGRLSQALEFFERAWERNPNDPNVHFNLGLVAWKLDMLEAAEKFYRIAHELDPTSADAIINLAGVLRDRSEFSASIELLRAAIYAHPENANFWNSLGTTLLDGGDPEQALTFYEEALRLKPDFARAWHNLGYAHELNGDAAASVEASERALQNPQTETDRIEMLYSRAMSLLGAGRVAEGWRDYATRLAPNYQKGTIFLAQCPMWDGEASLAGKRVLFIGEQGVGDEVLFMNVLPDLVAEIGSEGELIVACDKRLAAMVQRTYPGVTTVGYATRQVEARAYRGFPKMLDWENIDLWLPMASAMSRYRPSVAAFPATRGHFAPDPERVASMRAALDALPAGIKVGMCWKSKIMDSKRSKYFAPFVDWRNVLQTPGATFVNLQYGDVDEEIAQAARDYGVTIHQIPDLDLMQDLEGVAALGAALDLTLGPLNASTNLAAAVGAPVWFIALKTDWVFLGTQTVPWYPSARAFFPEVYGVWREVYDRIAGELPSVRPAGAAAA